MKILFGVQTEGNGHITQAIATKQYLQSQGIEVTTAFAAKKKRGLSKYFTDEFLKSEYKFPEKKVDILLGFEY